MGIATYASLFSGAGIGCYGFKEAGFECIATVEIVPRRLAIQRFNKKCRFESGYICGDLTDFAIHWELMSELEKWKNVKGFSELDVLIATPPCQGISIANHKKHNELPRNSLVVESIKIIREINPKFFIIENVRGFLKTACTDINGEIKSIKECIDINLSGNWNILSRIVNFKDYGCPSSRTRTLIIGVRKDIAYISPHDVFPDLICERTLRQVIGDLPSLSEMGEISCNDIYHNFRPYNSDMRLWIHDLKEGASAFDNTDPKKCPHTIINGKFIPNVNKNGDKYRRQYWDKVAPCIHTRNDILSSQNTIHPKDDRVFSIREIMLMMSVPDSFLWSDTPFIKLNNLSTIDKRKFLFKEEMNIRQCLGEAVPTIIFNKIAKKIKKHLENSFLSNSDIKLLLSDLAYNKIPITDFLRSDRSRTISELTSIAETSNPSKKINAAWYTRRDICFAITRNLPDPKDCTLEILEPAVGAGAFLSALIDRYAGIGKVHIDAIDIDPTSLDAARILTEKSCIPNNISIDFINADFLLLGNKKYDIVIGNPPFGKINDKNLLECYRTKTGDKRASNISAFFIEKALEVGRHVALIMPKSVINAPEFANVRSLVEQNRISRILDFGEKAFKGVRIETIALFVDTSKKPLTTVVDSWITLDIKSFPQTYITDAHFPYWLLYRNDTFDKLAEQMQLGIFDSFRDRVITKKDTNVYGKIRVLKSRNIGDRKIINIPGYDCYMDDVHKFNVSRYLGRTDCILIPNLSCSPRACFMPPDCVADGSVAILSPHRKITNRDLAFFATKEFTDFYAIARNHGTRSLNIDNNSVFFFGKRKSI